MREALVLCSNCLSSPHALPGTTPASIAITSFNLNTTLTHAHPLDPSIVGTVFLHNSSRPRCFGMWNSLFVLQLSFRNHCIPCNHLTQPKNCNLRRTPTRPLDCLNIFSPWLIPSTLFWGVGALVLCSNCLSSHPRRSLPGTTTASHESTSLNLKNIP